jgi:O-antigen ligase
MNESKSRLARLFRIAAALLLVGLEFTNAFTFLAEGGNSSTASQHSRYPLQFAAYGVCFLIVLLDHANIKRLFEKSIVRWAGAVLALLTWAMLVRAFNTPAGIDDYRFLREFGLRVNNIGFLLSCVLIFDDPYVLYLTKRAVVIATLVGVSLNIYDFLNPGIFSNIPGRAAGLYVQPNGSGMALVFGCLIGLTVIRRGWVRAAFFACVFAGVAATFSREALLALLIVAGAAGLSHALPLRRLVLIAAIGFALFAAFNLTKTFQEKLSTDTWSRLTFQWSDASTKDRERLAAKTLEAFEEAPLLGQGFGTAIFWGDDASHNSYLSFLADCGILGIFILPGLIFSLWRKSWDFYAFAASFLLWGLFSHTLLEDFFSLICIAIQADEQSPGQHRALAPYFFPFGAEAQVGSIASPTVEH